MAITIHQNYYPDFYFCLYLSLNSFNLTSFHENFPAVLPTITFVLFLCYYHNILLVLCFFFTYLFSHLPIQLYFQLSFFSSYNISDWFSSNNFTHSYPLILDYFHFFINFCLPTYCSSPLTSYSHFFFSI